MKWLNTLTAFYLLSFGMDADEGMKGLGSKIIYGLGRFFKGRSIVATINLVAVLITQQTSSGLPSHRRENSVKAKTPRRHSAPFASKLCFN